VFFNVALFSTKNRCNKPFRFTLRHSFLNVVELHGSLFFPAISNQSSAFHCETVTELDAVIVTAISDRCACGVCTFIRICYVFRLELFRRVTTIQFNIKVINLICIFYFYL
jgi:hypothetical protein